MVEFAHKLRIAVMVNVVPEYRIPMWEMLAQRDAVDLLILRPEPGFYASALPATSTPEHAGVVDTRVSEIAAGPLLLVRFPDARKLLREWNADVVLTEARMGLIDAIGLALFPIRRRDGRRIAVAWWLAGWRNRGRAKWVVLLSDLVASLVIRRGDAAACYGSQAAARAQFLGLPPTRIIVAQNSTETGALPSLVDEARLLRRPSQHGPLRVIFVGQVLERKCLDWVLSSMADPGGPGAQVTLRIVGAGPAVDALRAFAQKLGLGERVEWVGETYEPTDLANHIAWAEVGVLPHAGGLMLNTCMAAGLPVICGQADGTEVDLVIDNVTGWLLEGKGPRAMTHALGRVLAQRAELVEVGSRARTLIESSATMVLMVDGLIEACRVAQHHAEVAGP